jgi:hypothetical protein
MKNREKWRPKLTLSCSAEGKEGMLVIDYTNFAMMI